MIVVVVMLVGLVLTLVVEYARMAIARDKVRDELSEAKAEARRARCDADEAHADALRVRECYEGAAAQVRRLARKLAAERHGKLLAEGCATAQRAAVESGAAHAQVLRERLAQAERRLHDGRILYRSLADEIKRMSDQAERYSP